MINEKDKQYKNLLVAIFTGNGEGSGKGKYMVQTKPSSNAKHKDAKLNNGR